MLALPSDFRLLPNKELLTKNLQPAIVLFLVALPLNMGVALASGMPAYVGIISGVVGATLVGALSGAPLMVSGPDAGIGVLVLEMIQEQGIAKLGVIVLLAGLMQLAWGLLRGAKWYRAFSPAVVNGMLGGMGLIIVLTQFLIMLESAPLTTGLANIQAIPEAVLKALIRTEGLPHHPAACIGILTIITAVLWGKLSRGILKAVPAPLVAIAVASGATGMLNLPIQLIKISPDFMNGIKLPEWGSTLAYLAEPQIWICAGTLAFVASAQSLITATAIDATAKGHKSKMDRELIAQGIGNIVCGLLGALPIAGVLLRSMANVQSGANSRWANILHGVFIALAVCTCPYMLNQMPASALAAILVLIGCRMVCGIYTTVKVYERSELVIVGATVVAILATNLFTGVLIGFALAAIKELWALAYLGIKIEKPDQARRMVIHLGGAATFLQLPRLAEALESVPANAELHVRLDHLTYIDHGCLELLMNWSQQHREQGGDFFIDWGSLEARFRPDRGFKREPSIIAFPESVSRSEPIQLQDPHAIAQRDAV